MLSVLIVTRGATVKESIRGPKPVFLSRGCVRCEQIGLAPGELCVPPAPTQRHSSRPRGKLVLAHEMFHADWT
jgi:hypothetical protein